MVPIQRCRAATVLGLALIVASCGGTAAPAGGAVPATSEPAVTSETAASEPAGTEPAGTEPAVTAVPTASAIGVHGAPELEAMLPSPVGGVQLQKLSFGGTSFAFDAGAPFDSSSLEPLLTANGKTIADVRLAIARPVDARPGALGTTIMALQVKGIDAATLGGASGGASGLATSTVIGGKRVLQAGKTYTYFKDDIAFSLLLPNPDDAAAVLAGLP